MVIKLVLSTGKEIEVTEEELREIREGKKEQKNGYYIPYQSYPFTPNCVRPSEPRYGEFPEKSRDTTVDDYPIQYLRD